MSHIGPADDWQSLLLSCHAEIAPVSEAFFDIVISLYECYICIGKWSLRNASHIQGGIFIGGLEIIGDSIFLVYNISFLFLHGSRLFTSVLFFRTHTV